LKLNIPIEKEATMSTNILVKLDLDSLCGCILKDHLLASSLLHVTELCKELLALGLPEEMSVTLIDPKTDAVIELADVAMVDRPRTIGEWALAQATLFSLESSLCPNCGRSTFADPVLFCDACGANPGRIHEEVHHAC
jgi:hypothetical protein